MHLNFFEDGKLGKTGICYHGHFEDNYLSWVLDAKIHLRANGLGKTIVDGSDALPEENAKAMIFLCRHIHEALKNEYVVVDEPLVMWKALCERYNH
ncbi:unnamed protein product [Prunus armeniaca]